MRIRKFYEYLVTYKTKGYQGNCKVTRDMPLNSLEQISELSIDISKLREEIDPKTIIVNYQLLRTRKASIQGGNTP